MDLFTAEEVSSVIERYRRLNHPDGLWLGNLYESRETHWQLGPAIGLSVVTFDYDDPNDVDDGLIIQRRFAFPGWTDVPSYRYSLFQDADRKIHTAHSAPAVVDGFLEQGFKVINYECLSYYIPQVLTAHGEATHLNPIDPNKTATLRQVQQELMQMRMYKDFRDWTNGRELYHLQKGVSPSVCYRTE